MKPTDKLLSGWKEVGGGEKTREREGDERGGGGVSGHRVANPMV